MTLKREVLYKYLKVSAICINVRVYVYGVKDTIIVTL